MCFPPSRSNWWLALNRDCYYGIAKDKRTERTWDLILDEKNREDIRGHQYKGMAGPKKTFSLGNFTNKGGGVLNTQKFEK